MSRVSSAILFIELPDRNILVGTPHNIATEMSGEKWLWWTYHSDSMMNIYGYSIFFDDGTSETRFEPTILNFGESYSVSYKIDAF